jgi:hypothetical protein
MLGAKLQPLVVEYLRGIEGSHDVLRDAFLDRGLEPLPDKAMPGDRLEATLARLPRVEQRRIASASVRRLVATPNDVELLDHVVEALDHIDRSSEADAPEGVRNELFRVWQRAPKSDATRLVFSTWMLVRGLPATTLRNTRAMRSDELDLQIAAVAAAIAR